MDKKIYIITDIHMRHKMLSDIGERPEGFTEKIIENWNTIITNNDTIINLGDVVFGMDKEPYLTEVMSKLNGKCKVLILGNHDTFPYSFYYRSGFDLVCKQMVIDNILLSHEPIDKLKWPDGVTVSIFGHYHGNEHRIADYPFDTGLPDYNHLALERTDLKPVLLEEFAGISLDRKRNKYFKK